ncbi:MAG TPA: hypothetical protein VI168_01120 [Croceibacterium sp.]
MAERNKSTTSMKPESPAAPKAANVERDLSLTDLASGILSKEIRPRVADIRRLAEAVLSGGHTKPRKAKADGEGKKTKVRPEEKGGKKKKKKLAKIPGQRAKK